MIEKISSISSKEEFIKYLQDLATDYTDNKDEWENKSIPDYLEQIASWIEDYADSPANDIEWENNHLKSAKITSNAGEKCKLYYAKGDFAVDEKQSENGMLEFDTEIGHTYTIIIYRLKGVIDTHVGFQTILQDVNGVMG